MEIPGVELNIISSGVGFVSKSDLLMAVTGSRIVLGFQTDAMPEVEQECRRHGIEVRLYDVIFKMAQDVAEIGGSLLPPEREEKITGKGTVIALFKSTRKGTILGCRVIDGVFAEGDRFRVVSPMGVTYTGKVESLHIGKNAVKMAKTGQEVGLKISDFKKARVGDQVECFETPQARATESWRPRAGVFRI
jgi:translation initiation factor IF-2